MDIAPRCSWHRIFSRWDREPPAKSRVTTTAYPLYDTHGNMVATLTKNASGISWNVGNERSYDVWGGVRSGSATGGPTGCYCANLGHVQDDESGLVYMRARYNEPITGRFISEDPAKDGSDWFRYCNNNSLKFIDDSGKFTRHQILAVMLLGFFFITQYATDGNQIETAYGIFMAAVSFSPFSYLMPEWHGDFLDIMPATFLMTWAFSIGSAVGGPVGAAIGTAIGAALMIAEYIGRLKATIIDTSMIVTDYMLRLEWYINDIERF